MNKYPVLKYKESEKKNQWEVIDVFIKIFKTESFVVPKGFITDLASVPRFIWPLIPPFGKWIPATVIHDYNYRIGDYRYLTRRSVDKLMYDMMLEDNVPKRTAFLMYHSVRVFGKGRWKKCKRTYAYIDQEPID